MKIINISYLMVVLTLSVLIAGCQQNERYARTVEMPLEIADGQKIVLSSNIGSIGITGYDDVEIGKVMVRIIGKGDTVEKAKKVAESISITMEGEAGKNNIYIKSDKPAGIKDDSYMIDYTVRPPKNISAEVDVNVGGIVILNITGDIDAKTNVGAITCKNIVGKARLETNFGKINASYSKVAPGQVDAVLLVDVGSIAFRGPKNLSAQISAETEIGSISTRLPLTLIGDQTSKSTKGVIGNGEGNIKLKTNVGSISFR